MRTLYSVHWKNGTIPKGIDILLKSFCQLKNRPELIMAGAGADIDRIKII